MATSYSSSHDSNRFISVEHEERYFSLLDRKIIDERPFNLHPDQQLNIYVVLKKHKLTYLNSQIHHVDKELVLEFYANAYIPSTEDIAAESELISWVIGKQIQYDWKMMNMLLKMKFGEPNCEYQLMKMSYRTG